MTGRRAGLLKWGLLGLALGLPFGAAITSPLLAWRDPVYILAGLAGVVALSILLVQPLLARGALPGLPAPRGRRLHRWTGSLLVLAVLIHVGALWITSPPDVVDALLLVSPTPFSVWGVLAMWAVIATAGLAGVRRRLSWRRWRLGHGVLAGVVVLGSVLHAVLIEGTMETVSKLVLCGLVLLAWIWGFWGPFPRRR